MTYVIVLMSLTFVGIAFLVTEKNAKYLRSGYNVMSNEERKKVDLNGLIIYFRNFFIFLGITFLLISLLLLYFVNETALIIFICGYPVLASIYWLVNSRKFYTRTSGKP